MDYQWIVFRRLYRQRTIHGHIVFHPEHSFVFLFVHLESALTLYRKKHMAIGSMAFRLVTQLGTNSRGARVSERMLFIERANPKPAQIPRVVHASLCLPINNIHREWS